MRLLIFANKNITMTGDEIMRNVQIAAIFMFFIVIAWMLAEFKGMKDELRERMGINNESMKLRLQAYERLSLFAERCSLKNLVARTGFSGLTVVDYQLALLDTIKSEYEYNVSQQIYVSPDMWKAIGNLKDQNIFIINQIAAMLQPNTGAIELSRALLQYAGNKDAELSVVVLDALQFEAKKIM
ncbi:MAG TPA: hypothetical protein PLY34_14560 [Ferruginibacter sp.]|nr:hypothetical protein [Ferruginibacter sp.]HPH92143.1 hypothetical protein [Ferruginibacter sp.]